MSADSAPAYDVQLEPFQCWSTFGPAIPEIQMSLADAPQMALMFSVAPACATALGVQSSTPPSSGSCVVTYTWKVKVVAPLRLNCQFLLDDSSPLARMPSAPRSVPEYWKYGWLLAVNVPVPSALATVTPLLGSVWKKTRTPLAFGVVPLAVAQGWPVRFSTVTSPVSEVVPVVTTLVLASVV